MAQPAEVEQLFRNARLHAAEAVESALSGNTAAYRLMAVTEQTCRWLHNHPEALATAHPAMQFVWGNMAALEQFLVADPTVARWLAPVGVRNLLIWWFAWHLFGDEAHSFPDLGLTFRRLLPDQRVEFRASRDGQPSLSVPMAPGADQEYDILKPVAKWDSRRQGFPTEKTTRQDAHPPEVFANQLLAALKNLRHPKTGPYRDGKKIPLTAIADQLGCSRETMYPWLIKARVDRNRVRYWQIGDPLPRPA